MHFPVWLLLIASTVVLYFSDAAWGGQPTKGLKTSFDTVLLSSSLCNFIILTFTPVKEWRREEVVRGTWTV